MPKRLTAQSNTTLIIPNDYRVRLEEIARQLGYTQTRGAGTGKIGSISALVCAIAKGDLIVSYNIADQGKNDANA